MAFDLENRLVVGISTRVLFDLSYETGIFEREGLDAYYKYQVEHEEDILNPGPGFELVRSFLAINKLPGQAGRVEVVIMSHNNADTSLRVFKSIEHYGLNITRAVLAGGSPLAPYLKAFQTDLFLSLDEKDVQQAIDCGIAAGIVCAENIPAFHEENEVGPIRIAFDGDAVLFSEEAEQVFAQGGLEAFAESEKRLAQNPLPEGPFAKFLKTIAQLQQEFSGTDIQVPVRTALVTARCAPSHERVIRTLRAWNVRIDESFFLGGVSKKDVLAAFGAHIFFDDQEVHTKRAAEVVLAARVPWRSCCKGGGMNEI